MLKTGKLERAELYKDNNTQAFLNKFLTGEISQLEPVYDPKLGYHYQAVDAIVGDRASAELFLNRLYEAGILERVLYDKIIGCPKCGSGNTSTHYCCTYCKSFSIQRSALIEHVKCGYMDVEGNFQKGDKLVCPKCHEELRKPDVDYRRAGTWCTCKDCNKSFDIPITAHFCRACKENFTFENAVIKDVYTYSLKDEAKSEIGIGWIVIAPIREFFKKNGFEVESPAFMKGKSGANHMFDIAAFKGDTVKNVAVIDLAASTDNIVSEQPVIALFAKVFDVSPHRAYLIAIPKINENAKKMAELYNIQVIEAKDQEEVISALKEKMKK